MPEDNATTKAYESLAAECLAECLGWMDNGSVRAHWTEEGYQAAFDTSIARACRVLADARSRMSVEECHKPNPFVIQDNTIVLYLRDGCSSQYGSVIVINDDTGQATRFSVGARLNNQARCIARLTIPRAGTDINREVIANWRKKAKP